MPYTHIDNPQIAAMLDEVALLMALSGEDSSRIHPFSQAARIVESLTEPLAGLAVRDVMQPLNDADVAIMAMILEYLGTGHVEFLEHLHTRFPETVLELLKIPGLGPKRVRCLFEDHGVATLERLRTACENNELAQWDGFALELQEDVLAGVAVVERQRGLFRVNDALLSAVLLVNELSQLDKVMHVGIAGGLRRQKELVRNIDLVVVTDHPREVTDAFLALADIAEVKHRGTAKTTAVLKNGIPVDMRPVKPEQFPFALLYCTGSRAHNARLRHRARERGWRLTEHGLFGNNGQPVPCNSEASLHALLELPYIPPELRENCGEFDAGRIPKLVAQENLQGLVHCHSTWSDGGDTLDELAQAAEDIGYSYLVATDHSQSAEYVNGLTPGRVMEQHLEIDRINRSFKSFRILKGMESDIRSDGSLDYSQEVLRTFEVVIVSVHSALEMNEKEATDRIVRALEQPYAMILGHPTGRLLLSRAGYPLNMDKVVDAAVANGVAIEINANPRRLDMDWRHLRRARDKGAKFVIGPDAHRIAGMHNVRYGVGVARKGWLTPQDVLNCLPVEEFLRCLRKS